MKKLTKLYQCVTFMLVNYCSNSVIQIQFEINNVTLRQSCLFCSKKFSELNSIMNVVHLWNNSTFKHIPDMLKWIQSRENYWSWLIFNSFFVQSVVSSTTSMWKAMIIYHVKVSTNRSYQMNARQLKEFYPYTIELLGSEVQKRETFINLPNIFLYYLTSCAFPLNFPS